MNFVIAAKPRSNPRRTGEAKATSAHTIRATISASFEFDCSSNVV